MADMLMLIGYQTWVVPVLLVLPILGALLVAAAPASQARSLALVVALVEFVISARTLVELRARPGGCSSRRPFRGCRGWGVFYRVGIDGISLFMVLLTTLTMPLCVLGSWNYITQREKGFYSLLLVLLSGILGVFVSLDLFLFYVFWELMLIPMYFLIGIWGGSNRLYAAIKFFIYTMVGSLLMLVAILVTVWFVADADGRPTFAYDHILLDARAVGAKAPWLFAAFALAFAIKVPIFPFHTWLPDAHVEAPTAGSVHPGRRAAQDGDLRVPPVRHSVLPRRGVRPAVATVAVVLAVDRDHLRRARGDGAARHQEAGGLLLGQPPRLRDARHLGGDPAERAGRADGHDQPRALDRRALLPHRHALRAAAHPGYRRLRRHREGHPDVQPGLHAGRASRRSGCRGSTVSSGEFLVLLGSFGRFPWATGIATTGVIFAAAYLLWALQRIIFNKLDKPENESLTDLTPREWAVLAPLLIGIIWLGLYPAPVLRRMEPTSRYFVESVQHAIPQAAPILSAPRTGGHQ